MAANENTTLNFPKSFPPQEQNRQPGLETLLNPSPVYELPGYVPSGKLSGKIAVITGGDSGIGKAVSVAFAKEGADLAIIYRDEHEDAKNTKEIIDGIGRRCLLISGNIGDETFCMEAVNKVIKEFGTIDILVNNAAEQHSQKSIEDITKDQLENTFKTNFFGAFYLTKASLPHLKGGSCIINTTSVTAYKGDELLIDYSCSKGALATFTRSMALSLVKRNIRVNAVAPGPVWTPLIPSSFSASEVASFGSTTQMGRAAQPAELAGAYVYLASQDSSYVTGQTIHVNGGTILNI